jgi:hypothetical protein
MNVADIGGQAVLNTAGPGPTAAAHLAMPEVAATLSTWRWAVRQIPVALGTASAIAAVAAGVWGFISGGQLLMASAIAWELTALLALWLQKQWRENEDLAHRMDQLAHHALHAGGQVLEGLQAQNQELSQAVQSLQNANRELQQSADQLGQERDALQRTILHTEAELVRFQETEQLRERMLEQQSRLRDELGAFLQLGREQMNQETYWAGILRGLDQLAQAYDQLLNQEREQLAPVEQLESLIQQVEVLRGQFTLNTGSRDAEPLQEALERVTQQCSQLSQQLASAQRARLSDAAALDHEMRRGEQLELELGALKARLATAQRSMAQLLAGGSAFSLARSIDPAGR